MRAMLPAFMLGLVVCLCSFTSRTRAQCQPSSSAAFAFPPTSAPGLRAQPVFRNLSTPRGIAFDAGGALLVVERGVGVSALVNRDDPACVGWFRTLAVNNSALTHGIAVDGGELYVSSQLEVLLYAYDARTRTVSAAPPTVIVNGLPSDGDLNTRTLLITPAAPGIPRSILVSDGPLTNLDFTAQIPANGRSQIRRFALGTRVPAGGYNWTGAGAELLAFGIRNPAGLALDPNPAVTSRLWVVENGASLNTVIGDAASTNNPADELELVDLSAGARPMSYGFPFCHTGFDPLPAPFDVVHPGDQFSVNTTTGIDNAWCRNPANNVPPRLLFQPHSVPLDIKFYTPAPAPAPQGLPPAWRGDAFVSFHGSFDRVPPTGYGVVHVPWTLRGPVASRTSTSGYSFLVQVPNLNVCPGQCIRPVGLAFDVLGRLFVSSDSTGEVFYIRRA